MWTICFFVNTLWDTRLKRDNPANTFRLTGADIHNAVSKQLAFRAAHPLAGDFKLDFPFNGAGAVVYPKAATLAANLKTTWSPRLWSTSEISASSTTPLLTRIWIRRRFDRERAL